VGGGRVRKHKQIHTHTHKYTKKPESILSPERPHSKLFTVCVWGREGGYRGGVGGCFVVVRVGVIVCTAVFCDYVHCVPPNSRTTSPPQSPNPQPYMFFCVMGQFAMHMTTLVVCVGMARPHSVRGEDETIERCVLVLCSWGVCCFIFAPPPTPPHPPPPLHTHTHTVIQTKRPQYCGLSGVYFVWFVCVFVCVFCVCVCFWYFGVFVTC